MPAQNSEKLILEQRSITFAHFCRNWGPLFGTSPIDGSAWPGLAWLGFGRLAWFALARPRLSQLASPQLGLSQEQQHWRGEAPPTARRRRAVVVVGASPGVVAGAVAAVEETSQVEPRRDEPNLGKSGERLPNGFGYFGIGPLTG